MAKGFSFDVSGFAKLPLDLNKIAKGIEQNEKNAVRLAGLAYANDVKAAITALGLYITGDYRRRVHVEVKQDGIRWYAYIGTDAPQAKRLEFGFWDMVDSLGRHFMQYPRPHWRPTWDANVDRYGRIMMAALNDEAPPEWHDFGAEKKDEYDFNESVVGMLRPDITGGIL